MPLAIRNFTWNKIKKWYDEESKSKYFCKILYNNEEVLSEIKSLFKYVEEKNKKNV